MRYTSTRNQDIDVGFADALLMGYAPDGGLFVPRTELPPFNGATLRTWRQLDYATLMEHILRLYIDPEELSDAELTEACQNAMEGFEDPAHAVKVVPLRRPDDPSGDAAATTAVPQLFLSELFHGPTFCFKDLGLRVVIQLLHVFTQRRQQKALTLVVATTGDTGPAAVQAVADLPPTSRVRIVVAYPQGQISDFQRRQMTTTTTQRDSVRIVAFAGGGDDMDGPIHNVLRGKDASTALRTGVNSYNIVCLQSDEYDG